MNKVPPSNDDKDQVLNVEGNSGTNNKARAPLMGNELGRGRGRTNFNKATIEYEKCPNLGHFQYECPKLYKEENHAESEEEEILLVAYTKLHEAKRSSVWFLDSRCSNHICQKILSYAWTQNFLSLILEII